MKIPVCIIHRYAYNNSTEQYNTNYEELTAFADAQVNYGYKDKKDTFGITLLPTKSFNSLTQTDTFNIPNISVNDLLLIYMYYDDDDNIIYKPDGLTVDNLDSFLLFRGIVDKFNYTSSQGTLAMSLSGNNQTEILLRTSIFFSYRNLTVPDMLCDIGIKLRKLNENKILFLLKDFKGDGTDTNTGNIITVKDNNDNDIDVIEPGAWGVKIENGIPNYTDYLGGYIPGYTKWGIVPEGGIHAYKKEAYFFSIADDRWYLKANINLNEKDSNNEYIYRFPITSYYETYKPLYSHLAVISNSSYTLEPTSIGAYIAFVTSNNVLKWEPKIMELKGSVSESSTQSTNISKETRDIYNAVIVNAGKDARNHGIFALYYNTNSMTKYGSKWKYITNSNVAEQLQAFQKESSGVDYNDDNKFPASYPVDIQTPKKSSIVDENNVPKWEYSFGDKLNNDKEFNTYIRRVAREQAKDDARGLVTDSSDPRFFGTMKLDLGTLAYNVGDYITLEVPSLQWAGIGTKKLRIQDINHTINTSGWTTTLKLEQDNDEAKTST